ncbi:helix-turn-helix domain-containing protein [Longitalea arenae]|uniref:helix-turn-helix domain-containing protein n=1 Tax=Longitalea arenae TaxID=2812558 RepID=UPI001F076021|nr:helix-turn-helix domain-containing protein [Longitalea arenae]
MYHSTHSLHTARKIDPTDYNTCIYKKPGYQFDAMCETHPYSIYVRNAVAAVKQQIDRYPLRYRTCRELLEATSTINRRMLERAFKYEYGFRIKEYQVKQRLLCAKTFLLEGMPIKRVAIKCYYRSHSAFCRAFKREFNITPSMWLRS